MHFYCAQRSKKRFKIKIWADRIVSTKSHLLITRHRKRNIYIKDDMISSICVHSNYMNTPMKEIKKRFYSLRIGRI